MASVQQQSLSNANKATLEEVLKAANHSPVSSEDAAKVESVSHAILGNRTGKELHILDTMNWSGIALKPWPLSVPNEGIITFDIKGTPPSGSKTGVAYTDRERKWVLAFHRPANKVYVTAGRTGRVNWQLVEEELDKSGDQSNYEDAETGAFAVATFDKEHPNRVVVVFGSVPIN